MRNLKTLGLAFVAVLAMSAMAATAAQAVEHGEFTADSYPAHLDGTDIDPNSALTAPSIGGVVSCGEDVLSGTLNGASTDLTVLPTFTNCPGNRTVTTNGCHFTFEIGTFDGEHGATGPVELVCPGAPVEVHIYTSAAHTTSACTLTLGSQAVQGEPEITVETGSSPSTDSLRVQGTVEGIDYQVHGGCVGGATPTFTDGIYHFDFTISGTDGNEEHNGLRIS